MEDYNFVQDLPDAYLCQVCLKVLQEPHVTECCGQHYCKACLENWFSQNRGRKTCPQCRATNFNHMIYKPLQRQINELEVYCTNRSNGCQATMQLSNLDNHLNICQYCILACPNNCGTSVMRKDLDAHLNNWCQLRRVGCSYCELPVRVIQYWDHTRSCHQRPVQCPRQCGASTLRYCDLPSHEDCCPNMPVPCEFYEAGCKQELLRKDYADHMVANTTNHLATIYSSLKAKCDYLKTNCDNLKANCDKLQQENEALKQENRQLQSQTTRLKTDFETFKRSQKSSTSLGAGYTPPSIRGAGYTHHHRSGLGELYTHHHRSGEQDQYGRMGNCNSTKLDIIH